MAKPIKQIQQQLDQLAEQTRQLSQEIYHLYQDYLKSLSQATYQQLILAVYHVCTQVYPDHFLALAYRERQKLQETIKESLTSLEDDLLASLKPSNLSASPIALLESFLLSLPDNLDIQIPKLEPSQDEHQALEENQEFICENPEQLMLWCRSIEQKIHHTLDKISKNVNQLLQQAKIMQNSLPPKLLEMAVQAEESGIPTGTSPNILNLMVEAKSSDEKDSSDEALGSGITKITAIHLRLSDIEFAAPSLTLARKQLRQTLDKVNKLRQQMRQAQKEYAIAQAEAAWRASWID